MTVIRSSRAVLAAAAAVGTVLAGASFATPALAEDDGATAASSTGIADATLDWGLKQSFRNYITGPIANGSITLADGAEENADGSFRFTEGTGQYDPDTHVVDSSFQGSVHFEGHDGTLDLKLSDLRVVTEGSETGAIFADVTVSGETTQDVEFASLDLSGVSPVEGDAGTVVYEEIPATLTAEGSEAFEYQGNPMYAEGTQLDPATLTVTPETDSGDSGSAGSTSGGSSSGSSSSGGSTSGSSSSGNSTSGGSSSGGSSSGGSDSGGSDSEGTGTEGSGSAAADGTVYDGNLDWGVKESFRSYVTGSIANGSISLSGGATETDSGYRFPDGRGEYDDQAPTLEASFSGGVRFTGHDGVLDLSFSNLSVSLTGDEGELIADVSSKDQESGEVTEYNDVAVANLTVADGAWDTSDDGDVLTLESLPATLTAAGAEAFGGYYETGEELDPVTLNLALTEDADLGDAGNGGNGGGADDTSGSGGSADGGTTPAGASGGALADTGSGIPATTLLAAAAGLTAAGAAFAYAARRRRLTVG